MPDKKRAEEIVAAMDAAFESRDRAKLDSVDPVIAKAGWGSKTPLDSVISWTRKAIEQARTMDPSSWPPPLATQVHRELKTVID